MRRTTATGRVVDKFGAGKDGHRDRVMDGAVIVAHGTIWEAAMGDAVQEELANAIEDAGEALDPDDNTQLAQVLAAIRSKADGAIPAGNDAATNAIVRFADGSGETVKGAPLFVDDDGNITYGAGKVRSIIIPACAFVPENNTVVSGLATDGSYRNCGTDSAHFLADVSKYVNDRCTIIAYGVQVNPGAARSGGNAMTIKLYRNPFPGAAVQLGSGDSDNGATGAQLLDETLVAPHAVDREANGYTFDLKVGNTSASYPDSILYGFVTISEAGPGLGAT